MLRRTLLLVMLLLAVAVTAACGREVPEDEGGPAPTGGDPTGAFGEPGGEGEGGRVRIAGVPASVRLARSAARGFEAEDPSTEIVLAESDAGAAIAAVCAGKVEIAGTDRELTAAERSACVKKGEGAVELHVADAGGKPVYFVTTQKALFDKLELESYVDFFITNAEATAQQAGLEPLDLDELQETQTRFEQGLAGVG